MAVLNRQEPPPSPCNFTCIVDRKKSWCVGCLRTLDEIGRWEQLTVKEQWDVIEKLDARRASAAKRGA